MGRSPGPPPPNYQQKLQLGPGGHWYLNGMPVDMAGGNMRGLPGAAPRLNEEHVIDVENHDSDDSDYAPEKEKRSSTLDYLSDHWVTDDDKEDDAVPIQGMVNETFNQYRPETDVMGQPGKDGWGRDVVPERKRERFDQGNGSNRNNANAGYGNRLSSDEIQGMVADPTFGKFRDRREDNRVAAVPYFSLRLFTGILALIGACFLVFLCVRLNTFHMLLRMTFDGMKGTQFLVMIPLLLTGGIAGISSRFSENSSVLAASCYLVVAAIAYFAGDGSLLMTGFLIVFGTSVFINLLYFFEKFENKK